MWGHKHVPVHVSPVCKLRRSGVKEGLPYTEDYKKKYVVHKRIKGNTPYVKNPWTLWSLVLSFMRDEKTPVFYISLKTERPQTMDTLYDIVSSLPVSQRRRSKSRYVNHDFSVYWRLSTSSKSLYRKWRKRIRVEMYLDSKYILKTLKSLDSSVSVSHHFHTFYKPRPFTWCTGLTSRVSRKSTSTPTSQSNCGVISQNLLR